MLFFLQLVGAVVVAFVLCVAILYVWLQWKIRSFTKQLTENFGEAFKGLHASMGGIVPPLRITLMRMEDHEWGNQKQVDELTESFLEAGFQSLGDYDVDPAMMELRAFADPKRKCYGVLYEHPLVGVWFDITSLKDDHSASFTLTTDQKNMMDRPEGHVSVRVTPLTTPKKAFEKFLEQRPADSWSDVGADRFVKRFEKSYAWEMDWRLKRGGPTREEVKRIALNDGTEFHEESVTMIRSAWAARAAEFYDEELFDRYPAQSKLSAAEWEEIRDRLVFIHEHTTSETIQQLLDLHSEEVDEDDDDDINAARWEAELQKIRDALRDGGPRRAFPGLLKEFRATEKYIPRGTVHEPIPADVYIRTEADD